jgi:hypothetical protein
MIRPRGPRAALAAGAACLLMGVFCGASFAHDAIDSVARKATLARLDAAQRTAHSTAAPAVRAAALFQLGSTLDELRELLNHDIASHGKTQGLETQLLVTELDAMPTRLVLSAKTRRYAANLKPYRDALALDPNGAFANRARMQILKGQFYDSFSDDPLQPHSQTRAELLEMIELGEQLHRLGDPHLDTEEIGFILAMHYLQALRSREPAVPRARERVAQLLREHRAAYPQSLKLATLEALAP